MTIMSRTPPANWGSWPPEPALLQDAMQRAAANLALRLRRESSETGTLILTTELRTSEEFARVFVPVNAESVMIGHIRASDGRAWDVEWYPRQRRGRLHAQPQLPRDVVPMITAVQIAQGLALAEQVLREHLHRDLGAAANIRIAVRPLTPEQASAMRYRAGDYGIGELAPEGHVVWSVGWHPIQRCGTLSRPVDYANFTTVAGLSFRE